MNQKQEGSAHIIVIVVLIVALMGALGYIFWQNVSQKKAGTIESNNHSSSAGADSTKAVVQTKSVQLAKEKLLLDIPAEWTANIPVVAADEFSPARDSGAINNDAGQPILYVTSGVGGLGGTCEENMKQILTIIESSKTSITESESSRDVFAVKSYYFDPAKGYAPFIFLSSSDQVNHSGTFKTCLPDLAALFVGRNVGGSVSIGTGGVISGNSTGFSMLNFKATKEQALNILNTADMKKAYTALRSAHY